MQKNFWEKYNGTNFDNIPFTIDKQTDLDCEYGLKYFKDKECKHARFRMQGTRKMGCCAHIRIVHYILFLDYQIKPKEKESLSKWKLRQLRESKLEKSWRQVHQICKLYSYSVSLPTNKAHSNHPTGPDIAFVQKVHPLLIAKISDLVSSNICDVYEQ